MADDETLSDLPLAQRASRYKLLAEDASQLASDASGEHARRAYEVLAEKSRIRSEQSEAALAGESGDKATDAADASDTTNELPYANPRQRRTGMDRRQGDRRRDLDLRKTIDDVDRMAAEAMAGASATEVPAERNQLLTAAKALAGLKAMLTGRK